MAARHRRAVATGRSGPRLGSLGDEAGRQLEQGVAGTDDGRGNMRSTAAGLARLPDLCATDRHLLGRTIRGHTAELGWESIARLTNNANGARPLTCSNAQTLLLMKKGTAGVIAAVRPLPAMTALARFRYRSSWLPVGAVSAPGSISAATSATRRCESRARLRSALKAVTASRP